mgnify:FL=1
MDNNLSNLWIEDATKKAKSDLKPVQEAYDSLKNKETRYAVGILRVLKIREKIVELWEKG